VKCSFTIKIWANIKKVLNFHHAGRVIRLRVAYKVGLERKNDGKNFHVSSAGRCGSIET
jgi:hypothetical protein